MDVTLPEVLALVTATGVATHLVNLFWGRARDQRKDAKQEGADKAALNGVVKDMVQIMEVQLPRLQQIEILTRENAVQIKNLAEIESKRSTSTDRMLDGIDTLVGALDRERKKGP